MEKLREERAELKTETTLWLLETIASHMYFAATHIKLNWVGIRETLGYVFLTDDQKQFVNERFCNRANWRNGFFEQSVPSLGGIKIRLLKRTHQLRGVAKAGETRPTLEKQFIRLQVDPNLEKNTTSSSSSLSSSSVPAPASTPSPPSEKNATSSSSSSSPHPSSESTLVPSVHMTTRSAPSLLQIVGDNIFNDTPTDSPFAKISIQRKRMYSSGRRLDVRRAQFVLVPELRKIHDYFVKESTNLDVLEAALKELSSSSAVEASSSASAKSSSSSSSTFHTDTNTETWSAADMQYLRLAATQGNDNIARNARRQGYRHFEKTQGVERNDKYSKIPAMAVSLAQEIRKLGTFAAQTVAHGLLTQVESLTKNVSQLPQEMSMRDGLHHRQLLRSGELKYMGLRKLQMRISKRDGSNPLLVPPFHRLRTFYKLRRPGPLFDGVFAPPVPWSTSSAGGDHRHVSVIHEHGADGTVLSPRPKDPRLPFAPHVFYRFQSVLDKVFEQEIYGEILNFFEEKKLNLNNYYLRAMIAIGGDGAGMDLEKSSKQSDHCLAYGFTVVRVIAIPKTCMENGFDCLCSGHDEIGECVGPDSDVCGQLICYYHPCPQSPTSFRPIAFGYCNENRADQHLVFMNTVHVNLAHVCDNPDGYTYTPSGGGASPMTVAIELVPSKADEKWKRKEADFHAGKFRCLLCNCQRHEFKEISRWCCADTLQGRTLKRKRAHLAQEAGASRTEQYHAGSGFGGDFLPRFLKENKWHVLLQGLHAAIAVGGRMCMDVFVMCMVNHDRTYTLPKKDWNLEDHIRWNHAKHHVKRGLRQQGCHVGLRDTAKLKELTLNKKKHPALIALFCANLSPAKRAEIAILLGEMADIMSITRMSKVPASVIDGFKTRCIVWSDRLNIFFPALAWPDYMHFLISHGQEMMEALGSVGLWNEQSSEHINKILKFIVRHLSRSNMEESMQDTIGRWWDLGDPMLYK